MGQSLAGRLPDVPRWVEARASLLWNRCEVLGLQESPELSLVTRDPATELVTVIGRPDGSAVEAAVRRNTRGGALVAPSEEARWLAGVLTGWHGQRAVLHVLGDLSRLDSRKSDSVGFLHPEILDSLPIPEELLLDLKIGAEHSPIAAAYVRGAPVSFCYAGAVTETLWDVSIDTLPDHRRRGYAAACVSLMIQHMRGQGKAPVWGAVEDNIGSLRLAQKLGFVRVDELVLFEAGYERRGV